MSDSVPVITDLRKYIATDFFGDQPHIRSRRVSIAVIVSQKRVNQWDVGATADNFGLTEAEVLSALLYYEEHRAEIDRQIADDAAEFERVKRQLRQN